MSKLRLGFALVLLLPALGCLAAKPAVGNFGVDLSARDLATRPGDDFDRYANGAWRDRTVLRDDQASYGSLIALNEKSLEDLQALVAELQTRKDIAPGTDAQKVRDLYLSYTNMAARNAAGTRPLKPLLDRIDAIDSMPKLIESFVRVEEGAVRSPIDYGYPIDRKDPGRYLASVGVSGLGLPDRSYYLDADPQFPAIRKAYVDHIAKMLAFAGVSTSLQTRARAVFELETALARPQWARAERRDVSKTYNLLSYEELKARYPGFDWDLLRTAQGLPRPEIVNVPTPSAIAPVIAIINGTPLGTWRDYLRFHALRMNAFLLTQEIDDAAFAFDGTVLNGVTAKDPLERRGTMVVASPDFLGDATGRLYVEKHFSPAARDAALELVGNLRRAMRANLEGLDWMGEATRAEALHKLSASGTKVGYPEKGRDFHGVEIVPGDLMANARALLVYHRDDSIRRISAAPDRGEWRMQPFEPNAYHNANFNEVVFPAAALQPPLFDANADPAANYGAIGALMGHELGHGFDDQGSKYDFAGIQRNWWTDGDRARFEAKAAALGAQYAKFCPFENQCLDPALTMGENIGDLAGLSMAYKAYHLSLAGKPAPVLEGLTGDQRFFLAYAQLWRDKARPEATLDQLKTDSHAPAPYRINGPVRNMDAWYEAFDVRPGDKLYLPPEQRVHIW